MDDFESAQQLLENAEAARATKQNDRAIDYCTQVKKAAVFIADVFEAARSHAFLHLTSFLHAGSCDHRPHTPGQNEKRTS